MKITEDDQEVPEKDYDLACTMLRQGVVTLSDITKCNKKFKDFKMLLYSVSKMLNQISVVKHQNPGTRNKCVEDYFIFETEVSMNRYSKISDCLRMEEMMFILSKYLFDNDKEEHRSIQTYAEYTPRVREILLKNKSMLEDYLSFM